MVRPQAWKRPAVTDENTWPPLTIAGAALELAEVVCPPAVCGASADGARVTATDGCAQCGEDVAANGGNRDGTGSPRAGPELPVTIVPPAIRRAARGQPTRMRLPGAHYREGQVTANSHRFKARAHRTVTQLPGSVCSPAVCHSTRR